MECASQLCVIRCPLEDRVNAHARFLLAHRIHPHVYYEYDMSQPQDGRPPDNEWWSSESPLSTLFMWAVHSITATRCPLWVWQNHPSEITGPSWLLAAPHLSAEEQTQTIRHDVRKIMPQCTHTRDIHTHTYTHTHIHYIHAHTYTHTYNTYIHTYIHICIYIHTYNTHARTHKCTHTNIHTSYTRAYTHTYVHASTNKHTHVYTYTNKYTHTYTHKHY